MPGACLSLLVASQWRLTERAPPVGVWLYAACLGLVAGLGLALLWLPVTWLDRRTQGRTVLLPALLVLTLCFPFVHSLGVHLSGSDGLRARGFSAGLLELGFSAVFLSLPLLVWTVQRFTRRRLLDLGLGAALLVALLWLDVKVSRHQGELAALLEGCAALVFATLASTLLAAWPRAASRAALGSLGLVLLGVLLACALPERAREGRRAARVQESSVDYLDGRLARRIGPSRDGALLPLSATVCADALRAERFLPLALGKQRRRNVVLISIDSVRADHVRSQIAGQPLMPALVGFLREGRGPERAFTAYPATALAMSAAFTGLLPSELLLATPPADNLFTLAHGLVDQVEAVLPSGNYFQRPDVAHYLLRGASVHMTAATKQTDLTIARLRALRAAEQTHLLWVHYFEPHVPYVGHRATAFGESDRQRYASELAHVDGQLARLLSMLREEGWYDDSLIGVFADHGEAFGEHGHSHHHYLLYPWLVEVPFGLHAPEPLVFARPSPAHLTDLTPTVLHFLGAERAPRALTGQSLLSPAAGAERSVIGEAFPVSGSALLAYAREPIGSEDQLLARLARIEHGPGYPSKLALAERGHRLILHRGSGASELYAETDRRASHDLADSAPQLREQLVQQAALWRERLLTRGRCALLAKQAAGSTGQAGAGQQ